MRVLNIAPFDKCIEQTDRVSLKEALKSARKSVSMHPTILSDKDVLVLAKLHREKIVDKPHGICGYTFKEWAKFALPIPAFYQGKPNKNHPYISRK